MSILKSLPKLIPKDVSILKCTFVQTRNMAAAGKKSGKGAAVGKPKKVKKPIRSMTYIYYPAMKYFILVRYLMLKQIQKNLSIFFVEAITN